jgi:hypothetical protein
MSSEDTIIGLVGGVIVSVVMFYIGMLVQRRADRKSFLREHIRQFYPILRELSIDLGYALSSKLKDNFEIKSLEDVLPKISNQFESYTALYLKLTQNGLEPELESVDQNTANELKGLYILWKLENPVSVSSNFDKYHAKVIICRNLVESYLKGKWWQI